VRLVVATVGWDLALTGHVHLIVVLDIHHHAKADFLEIADTSGLPGFFPSLSEYREKDCG